MQPKYRLYCRSNRSRGTFYAQDCTGVRPCLGTKDCAEAEKLLQAKNEAHSQPSLSRELAKVHMHAQDPKFGQQTWADVSALIDAARGFGQGSVYEICPKCSRSRIDGS